MRISNNGSHTLTNDLSVLILFIPNSRQASAVHNTLHAQGSTSLCALVFVWTMSFPLSLMSSSKNQALLQGPSLLLCGPTAFCNYFYVYLSIFFLDRTGHALNSQNSILPSIQ